MFVRARDVRVPACCLALIRGDAAPPDAPPSTFSDAVGVKPPHVELDAQMGVRGGMWGMWMGGVAAPAEDSSPTSELEPSSLLI